MVQEERRVGSGKGNKACEIENNRREMRGVEKVIREGREDCWW